MIMDDNVLALKSTSKAKKGARSCRGRQRIEIKKLEDESKRQVTFSKRRQGLFKKATELSTLCGVEVGILTVSKFGRVFTTDNIDSVLETHPSFHHAIAYACLQKRNEVEEGVGLDEKLMEYGVALRELREKAAFRLDELSNINIIQDFSSLWALVADEDARQEESLNPLMAEQGIYEWCV